MNMNSAAHLIRLKYHALPQLGGVKLIVMTETGDYVGTVTAECANMADMAAAMADLSDTFRQWVQAFAPPQVQAVTADAMPGTKRTS